MLLIPLFHVQGWTKGNSPLHQPYPSSSVELGFTPHSIALNTSHPLMSPGCPASHPPPPNSNLFRTTRTFLPHLQWGSRKGQNAQGQSLALTDLWEPRGGTPTCLEPSHSSQTLMPSKQVPLLNSKPSAAPDFLLFLLIDSCSHCSLLFPQLTSFSRLALLRLHPKPQSAQFSPLSLS